MAIIGIMKFIKIKKVALLATSLNVHIIDIVQHRNIIKNQLVLN